MKTPEIVLFCTTVFAAVMAGLFFAYSFSVIPGLGKVEDLDYIKSMQSINKEIQNPFFFTFFFGTFLLLPLCSYLLASERNMVFTVLIVASVCYAVGVMGVTVFGNVPLNNQLANVNIDQPVMDLAKHRKAFENTWNTLNHIRTLASFLTVALLIYACLCYKK